MWLQNEDLAEMKYHVLKRMLDKINDYKTEIRKSKSGYNSIEK